MSLKAALKNIRSLLDSDPAEAIAKSREVLEGDPQNYQVYVIAADIEDVSRGVPIY